MSFSKRASTLLLLSCFVSCFVTPFALASRAEAQNKKGFSLDEPETAAASQGEQPMEEPTAEEGAPRLSDEQALEEEKAPDESFRKSTNPYEDPSKSYFFAGAAWRFVRLPSWTLQWFLEAAPSVGTAGTFFGEFGYRKDGFQITGSVGYMGWNFKGPFQLSGDQEADTEWLDGNFKFLSGTATFTWSTAFTDWFALEYGAEVGLAALFGDLIRSEAFKDNKGKWNRCPGWAGSADLPLSEATAEQKFYCEQPNNRSGTLNIPTNGADEDGAHYGVKATQVPPVVPILGPRLSLRFKPLAQLVLRVDVPLPVFPFGFMGGIAAQYGF